MAENLPMIAYAATIVPVRNVAATIAFYRETLEFEESAIAEDASFGIVKHGPAAVQLVHCDNEDVLKVTGKNISIYLSVKGVQALHERLKEKLIKLPEDRYRPLFDQPYGMREFHVKDPDGCLLFFGEEIAEGR